MLLGVFVNIWCRMCISRRLMASTLFARAQWKTRRIFIVLPYCSRRVRSALKERNSKVLFSTLPSPRAEIFHLDTLSPIGLEPAETYPETVLKATSTSSQKEYGGGTTLWPAPGWPSILELTSHWIILACRLCAFPVYALKARSRLQKGPVYWCPLPCETSYSYLSIAVQLGYPDVISRLEFLRFSLSQAFRTRALRIVHLDVQSQRSEEGFFSKGRARAGRRTR